MFDQINMIGQGVIMAFVNMVSDDKKVKAESNSLVNLVLPNVAKAVYKGMLVVYVDVNEFS